MVIDPGPLESQEAGDDGMLEKVSVVSGSGHVPEHIRLRRWRIAFRLLLFPHNLLKLLSPWWGKKAVVKGDLEVLIGWIALRLK